MVFAVGVLRAIAGLAWVGGAIVLFIEPAIAAVILAVATALMLWARSVRQRAAAASRRGQPKSFMGIAPGLATLAEIESRLDSGEITDSEAQAQLELLKGDATVESHRKAMEMWLSSGDKVTDEDESTSL